MKHNKEWWKIYQRASPLRLLSNLRQGFHGFFRPVAVARYLQMALPDTWHTRHTRDNHTTMPALMPWQWQRLKVHLGEFSDSRNSWLAQLTTWPWHRSCSHGSNCLHFAQHWEPARIAQVLPNNKRRWLLHLRCKGTWILGYTGYTHYTYLPKVGEFRFSFSWEKLPISPMRSHVCMAKW